MGDSEMCVMIISVLFLVWINVVNGGKEYCVEETFQATCPDAHVIMIQNASYGIMKRTRCTQGAPYTGYIGCQSNVLHIMDRLCSGRQSCEIQILDNVFDVVTSCPDGLRRYLEIDYTCVKARTDYDQCDITDNGILASSIITSPKCGSPDQPYGITGSPGQNVELLFHDFTYKDGKQATASCIPIGYIMEDVIRINKTICGNSGSRNLILYQSVSHSVQLVLLDLRERNLQGEMVLHHTVKGCSDPPLNPNTLYERDGDTIRYGCRKDDLVETSKCVDGFWDSPIINCSLSGDVNDVSIIKDVDQKSTKIDEGIMIGIIIGVAVLLSIIVLVCGIVYAVRRNQSNHNTDVTYSQGEKLSDAEFKMYSTMPHPFEKNMHAHVGDTLQGHSGFVSHHGHDPIESIPCDCDCMELSNDMPCKS